MTTLPDVIRNHFAYSQWATERLLHAGSKLNADQLRLDFETADKSILGTLAHIVRSERGWLGRIAKTPPATFSVTDDEDWDALPQKWSVLHQGWKNWAAGLSEEELNRILDYTDSKNMPHSEPLWQVALHVVNHSTHHRGQVSGFLRALGTTPPPLDFIAFMRLRPE